MGRRDAEKGGYVAERKEIEKIWIVADELLVSLPRSLDIKIDMTVVEHIEDVARRVVDLLTETGIGGHTLSHPGCRQAIDVARRGGDDGAARLLAIEGARKITHELAAKLKTHHMGLADIGIADVFQRSALHISDIASDGSSCDKLLILRVMAQLTFSHTQVAPEVGVDIIDIGVELSEHIQMSGKHTCDGAAYNQEYLYDNQGNGRDGGHSWC